MFTLQAPSAVNQLISAGMPESQARILLALLGNCAQELEHRGPVTFTDIVNISEGGEVNLPSNTTINETDIDNYIINIVTNQTQQLFRVIAQESKGPGDTISVKLLNSSYAATGATFNCYDPLFLKCAITGEAFVCSYFSDTAKYEVVSEFGLKRLGTSTGGALAFGGTVSVSLGGGLTITAHDAFMRSGDPDIASGTVMEVIFQGGQWDVVQAQCPAA